MGLSSARSYRIQKAGKDRLSYIWLNAITFYYTWENIGKQVQEVMSSPDMMKAPAHVHAYLRGYWDAKRESIWNEHTMWMLWCESASPPKGDGKLMTSREVDDLTKLEAVKTPGYNSPWSRINSDLSRHVWLDRRTGLPLLDKSLDQKFR